MRFWRGNEEMRSITKMLFWFVFLVLPLLVGTILHFVTGEPMFDYIDGLSGRITFRGETEWLRYGIVAEVPWIVFSGLVLFSTVKPEQQSEEMR